MNNFPKLSTLLAALILCSVNINAQDLQALGNDKLSHGNVLTHGMGYENQRFSLLKSINDKNVKRLVPVWSHNLNNARGSESQPIIYNGVIYATTYTSTVAIDALSGKQLWKVDLDFPADIAKTVCCGLVNRGVAIFGGKVFRGTVDAHIIAYDANSGKEVWKYQASDRVGKAITSAPMIANGVLITGIAGGEFGARGFLDGLDPETGKRLWRRYTAAGKDEKGGDTWLNDSAQTGGATTWMTGVYDQDLDMVYWGVGQPSPWKPTERAGPDGGSLDNLYSNSVIAIRPGSGEVVWHRQFTPNDPLDYDSTEVGMLVDMKVEGVDKKVLLQANRNGFFYVLDRVNGNLLAANPYIKNINWAEKIDLTTGRPVHTGLMKKYMKTGEATTFFPSAFGGKNWQPTSWNPTTGLVYANTFDFGMTYKYNNQECHERTPTASKKDEWCLQTYIVGFDFPKDRPHGYLAAIDPMTGKSKWQMPWTEQPSWSGTLSTAGNLVFTGASDGEFMAVNASTGKKLWAFQTGSGVAGQPITWEHKGVQYITVVSGTGGIYYDFDPRSAKVPRGSSVWTFALIK